jgi:hypothetical protein
MGNYYVLVCPRSSLVGQRSSFGSNPTKYVTNRTREDYMKRSDHNSDMDKVTDHMIRIEGKLDRLAERLLESK